MRVIIGGAPRGIIDLRRRETAREREAWCDPGQAFFRLLDQPRALRATWTALKGATVFESIARSVDRARCERVILTGMGSSYHGLHPLAIEMSENGWTPLMLDRGNKCAGAI